MVKYKQILGLIAILLIVNLNSVNAHPYYIDEFGTVGTGDGRFDSPSKLASSDDFIYVLDSGNDRIQIFESDGSFYAKFGGSGTDNGKFDYPYGIEVVNDQIYVSDLQNVRVQVFDLLGNFLFKFGSEGDGDGEFSRPGSIKSDGELLYISDYDSSRILVFTLEGEYVRQISSSGTNPGQVYLPEGIDIDGDKLFVADWLNSRIQVFNKNDGTFLYKFGDNGDGELINPSDVLVIHDKVLVADQFGYLLKMYDLDGTYVVTIGGSGSGDGQFNLPTGLATDGSVLWIADTGNDRVQVFDLGVVTIRVTEKGGIGSIPFPFTSVFVALALAGIVSVYRKGLKFKITK